MSWEADCIEDECLATVNGEKITIETTVHQAMLIARGLRHFTSATEPNWELSIAEVKAIANVIVGIEETLDHD